MSVRSSPAFSMGSAKRVTIEKREEVPGPAAYSAVTLPRYNSPRAVFPRAAKLTLGDRSESPGPALYSPKSLLGEGPKAVLTPRRDSQPFPASQLPGPNDYSPKPLTGSKGFSFAGKHPAHSGTEVVPGPGAYSPANNESVPAVV